jgi:hypothetical protein
MPESFSCMVLTIEAMPTSLHAHAVDHRIWALALGDVPKALKHVFFGEVDYVGGAGAARHVQTNGHVVNRDNLLCTHDLRGFNREQPDGSGTPDRNRVAGPDIRVLGGLPPGRQDVGKEQRLLVGHAFWHLHRGDVGHWHPHVFGLSAPVAALPRSHILLMNRH